MDTALLREFLRSAGGDVLFMFLETMKERQREIVITEAMTKPIEAIRLAAGRADGVSIVIQNLHEVRKGNGS